MFSSGSEECSSSSDDEERFLPAVEMSPYEEDRTATFGAETGESLTEVPWWDPEEVISSPKTSIHHRSDISCYVLLGSMCLAHEENSLTISRNSNTTQLH